MVKAYGKVPALAILALSVGLGACGGDLRPEGGEGDGLVEEAKARPPAKPAPVNPASDRGTASPAAGEDAPPSTSVDTEAPSERTDPGPEPLAEVRAAPPVEEPSREAVRREESSRVEPDDAEPVREARPTPGAEPALPGPPDLRWSPDLPEPRDRPRVERRPGEVEAPPEARFAPPGAREPEISVPAGSALLLEAETSLSSRGAWPGDRFRARVVEDVLDPEGMVLVPLGALVEGVVVRVVRGEEEELEPALELEPRALIVEGRVYDLDAEVTEAEMETRGARDGREMAGKAVAGAAAGAILGKILGKDARSTIAGAVAGAAAGAAVGAATGQAEVVLEEGARMEIVLRSELRLDDEGPGGGVPRF